MSDPKKIDQKDRATTQEIRRGRKFSLSEAVAREAGGNLKGASPVAPTRQVLAAVDDLLERFLVDGEGSLRRTILARLEVEVPLLAAHSQDPAEALRHFLEGILDSTTALEELVRQTDARWGREYHEKPHFNQPGQPAHPADPYTPEGVRRELEQLLASISD